MPWRFIAYQIYTLFGVNLGTRGSRFQEGVSFHFWSTNHANMCGNINK